MRRGERHDDARLVAAFPALRRLGEGITRRAIPFVQQAMVTDCGAACLAMALALHGREVPLEELRAAMAVGRDGVSAQRIVEVAVFYGLRARGVRIELGDVERLPRGSILHWNFSHFVVFDRMSSSGLHVVDPDVGPRTIALDDARKAFTGVALLLERGEAFAPGKTGGHPVWRHLRRAFADSDDWHQIVTVSVVLQVLLLCVPMIHGRLVDRVVPRNDVHLLTVLLCGLGVLLVFHFLAGITRAQLLLQLRTRFDGRMTFGFVEHLLRLPYAFFEQRQVGDLQTRVAAVAAIREVLTGAVLSALIDGTMMIGHLVFLAAISVRTMLLALGIAAVQVSVYVATRRKLRDLASGLLAKQADAANALNELLLGMESLKASGCEQRAAATWAARYVDLMNIGLRQGSLMTFAQSTLSTISVLGPVVLLVSGVNEVMQKTMTLGAMLSANALASGFLQPTMSLVSALQNLQMTRGQLARIDDVRETAPEQEPGTARMAPALMGAVSLRNVSFRYGPKLRYAVRDVTVDVAPGEAIAIVGRSGSGKTTLGRLLLGLYEPCSGAVLLDGLPLASMDLSAVRRQLGVVVQKPHVFGTSVRANIALGNPDAPLAAVEEAARCACIHDDIMAMPMQYETPVVAGGASMSGGQRQRLALARALLQRPAILLLDEATSALDSITEAAVQSRLAQLRCTRICIAHRLSTVIAADRILVMEDGALVEQGRHEELLARGGIYARLVLAQLAEERREAPPPRWPAAPEAPMSRTLRFPSAAVFEAVGGAGQASGIAFARGPGGEESPR